MTTVSSQPCPNCGDAIPLSFAAVRMATCPSCGTTVYLDDGRALDAGPSGEMHEAPLPAALGEVLRVGDERFELVGHARFSYGPGWWDEFWGLEAPETGVWISFDEGDVAVQRPGSGDLPVPTLTSRPRVGQIVGDWRVTEVETATCLAVRGNFPERLRVGDTYEFANLEDGDGGIASVEFGPEGAEWTIGYWVDRWQVRAP